MNETTIQKPDNYLVWAILSTVLCCIPFGVVAIAKALKVDSLWSEGKHQEAVESAKSAKTWTIAAAASAFVFCLLYFLILGVIVLAEL